MKKWIWIALASMIFLAIIFAINAWLNGETSQDPVITPGSRAALVVYNHTSEEVVVELRGEENTIIRVSPYSSNSASVPSGIYSATATSCGTTTKSDHFVVVNNVLVFDPCE